LTARDHLAGGVTDHLTSIRNASTGARHTRHTRALWPPGRIRHSFVSLLSDAGVPIEQISRLVGHSGTTTTETIYRKQIRPVIVHGADVMDRIFPGGATPHA